MADSKHNPPHIELLRSPTKRRKTATDNSVHQSDGQKTGEDESAGQKTGGCDDEKSGEDESAGQNTGGCGDAKSGEDESAGQKTGGCDDEKSGEDESAGQNTGGGGVGGGVDGALDRLFLIQAELTSVKDPFLYTHLFCSPEDQKYLKHEYERMMCKFLERAPEKEQQFRARLFGHWSQTAVNHKLTADGWLFSGNHLKGVDLDKSHLSYHLAGNNGSTEAMANLSEQYEIGAGTKQDTKESFRWRRLAALEGHRQSMTLLALKYRDGTGIPDGKVDHKISAEWLQKAVKLGDREAMCHLGTAYKNGLGVPQDVSQAIALWSEAVDYSVVKDFTIGAAADELAHHYFFDAKEKDLEKAERYAKVADKFWKPRSTLILGKRALEVGKTKYAFMKFREAACGIPKENRPQEALYLTGLGYLTGMGSTDKNEYKTLRYWSQVPNLAEAKHKEDFERIRKKFQLDTEDSCSDIDLSDRDSDHEYDDEPDRDHDDDPDRDHDDPDDDHHDDHNGGDQHGEHYYDENDDGGDPDDDHDDEPPAPQNRDGAADRDGAPDPGHSGDLSTGV